MAATAVEAMESVRQQSVDLVLLDRTLPDFDGLEIIEQLRGRAPLAVIVLSGFDSTVDRVAGLAAGADD